MAERVEQIGLIAGNGRFPFLVLESARRQNIDVIVAAIKGETSGEIDSCGYPVHWLSIGQLGKLIRVFKDAGVKKALMAGQVKHVQIFSSVIPDLTMIRMLASLKKKNTDSIIGGVVKILEESGITLIDSTAFLRPHLATVGPLTRRGLTPREQSDLDYGLPVAHQIAGLDIGQTIVVRDRAVVAIEAMEGTDAVIQRAGKLAGKKDLTVIKTSKPNQDMRFDVPVVGVPTIRNMIDSGATALVVAAGKTLILDREDLVALADQNGIAVVGISPMDTI
jgi:DUF1009 family protein